MFSQNIASSAEAPAPGTIGKQGDLAAPGHIILIGKIASELRGYVQNLEKIRAYPRATDTFWRGPISTREVVSVTPVKSEIGEGVLRGAPIEKV